MFLPSPIQNDNPFLAKVNNMHMNLDKYSIICDYFND